MPCLHLLAPSRQNQIDGVGLKAGGKGKISQGCTGYVFNPCEGKPFPTLLLSLLSSLSQACPHIGGLILRVLGNVKDLRKFHAAQVRVGWKQGRPGVPLLELDHASTAAVPK